MRKSWTVVVMFAVATALVSSLWASCGDDTAADTGPADTGVEQCKGKSTGDACSGGFCVEVVAGTMNCSPECTTPGDTCDGNLACYNIGTSGKNACLSLGTKTLADACGAINDCAAGLACLDMGGGSAQCFSICASVDSCSGDNPSCDDTKLGYKVCVDNPTTS